MVRGRTSIFPQQRVRKGNRVKSLEDVKRILKEHKKTIEQRFRAEVLGLFGSFVRGEQHEGSDLDVLVRLKEGATLFDLVGLAVYLEELLGLNVDVVPEDGVRKELRKQIFREVVPA
mgnify:CR=1 FL=1